MSAHARQLLAERVARTALLAATLCTPACVGSNYRSSVEREPRPSTRVVLAPEVPRFAQDTVVPVVLAAAEGRAELRLQPLGAAPIEFVRAGDLVLASDGRAAREVVVAAPTRLAALQFDGRTYSGELRVVARPGGGLRLLNDVDLEHYVEGVVAAELPLWSAEPAELEAQAIAVRTYALHSLGQRIEERGRAAAFLWDSVEDQAYRGHYAATPGNTGEARAARRLREAVRATHGQVLARRGRLVDARFHAACGGHTADLAAVFPDAAGAAGAGPVARGWGGVPCEPCAERARDEADDGAVTSTGGPPLGWRHTFDRARLGAAARVFGVGDRLLAVEAAAQDDVGRWLEVEVRGPLGARRVRLDAFRRELGFGTMKSALVVGRWPPAGESIQNGLELRGLGRGHGVGLCQEGARGYARRGWSAEQILAHYYLGSELDSLPVE